MPNRHKKNKNHRGGGGRGRGRGGSFDGRQPAGTPSMIMHDNRWSKPKHQQQQQQGKGRGRGRGGKVNKKDRRRGPWDESPAVVEIVHEDRYFRHQEVPRAHSEAVQAIVMAGENIYTAGRDKMLKRWKVGTNAATGRFELHQDLQPISLADQCNSMIFIGDWIFCGLGNGAIKGYKTDGTSCELLGHSKAVRCLLVHTSVLISGAADCTLRCWLSPDGGKSFACNNTIAEGVPGQVQCMTVIGEFLWVGGASGLVVVELSSLRVLQAIGPKKFVAAVLPFDGHLIVAYADGSIRIFDANGGAEKPSNFKEAPLPPGPVLSMIGLEIGPRLVVGHSRGQISSIDLPMFQLKKYWQAFERCKVQCMCNCNANGIFMIGGENGNLQVWQRQAE